MKKHLLYFLTLPLISTIAQVQLAALLLATPLISNAAWQFHESQSHSRVSGSASSVSGGMNLDLSCRGADRIYSYGQIYMVLFDYQGNAISRVDDSSMQIRLVFTSADGSTLHTFTRAFHYFAPDQAHVMTNKASTPLADAWGAASTMIFQSESGEEVARFDLSGTSQARARFRQVCGV